MSLNTTINFNIILTLETKNQPNQRSPKLDKSRAIPMKNFTFVSNDY